MEIDRGVRLMMTRLAITLALIVTVQAEGLPRFTFTNYDGQVVSNHTLVGKVTVVVPTYAKCVFACPMITSRLIELDGKLQNPETIQYLHVSIQPEEDTTEEILSHFSDHAIEANQDSRWLFANGPKKQIENFLEEIGIEITRTTVDQGVLIEHTTRVYVVDQDGAIAAVFGTYYWDDEEMESVLQRLSVKT